MIKNADRLIGKLDGLPGKLKSPITQALQASAGEMQGYAVVRIQKNSGTGRSYKRGKRVHTASAPGEFPNTDTGALVNSMRWESRRPLSVIWGAFIRYAKHLEFGTSRMKARPFIRPTFNALLPKAKERVRDAIKRALRG